ncbi:MAG: methyltransferase, partial [Rhodospirillales bacterium]|nr:methyltransferase [Rhodospirillales bacterium]
GGGGYDHVMANPPYLEASHGHPPANPAKHLANRETGADLAQWVDFCLTQARPKGSISFIHRADRIDQLISCLTPGVGGMVIFPLLPNAQGQKAAKRVLVRGDKGSKAPARMMPGLALHEADGAYTPVAQQVLRQGLGLTI